MARSATSSTTGSTTARRPTRCSCARATAKEKTLRNGDFIAYLPDDFHHIETPAGSGNALHLHFYGLSLEHLPDRVSVDMASGTAKRFMAKAKILTPLLTVQQVKAMLKSGEVFAFFDVREEGEFSIKGHPLFATPLPLSRLEPRAFALLPDPDTRIVLMDSGEEGQIGPRQPRRRTPQPDGLHQPRGREGRAQGLARRGLRGLHRRQRAEQGVRRGRRARQRHAAHRCRRMSRSCSIPRPTW